MGDFPQGNSSHTGSCINQYFGENQLAIRLNIILVLMVVKLIELNEQNVTTRMGDNNRGVG